MRSWVIRQNGHAKSSGLRPTSSHFGIGASSQCSGLMRGPVARFLFAFLFCTAFLAGASLSGAATPRFGAWVLLLPTLVLSALAAFDRTGSAAV
jgi:uncharacterized membrane protein YoaK (UPF0700 family)